jgi:Ca-activated chloride channel family protein
VLYLVAIAALGIALARPSMALAVPRDDATVILTLDVSGSMEATDVAPSRLDAAKQAASDFVDQLPPRFQVGLVVFSTDARLVHAPTTNRGAVLEAIQKLRAGGGTALGDAIGLSVEAADMATTQPSPSPSAPGGSETPDGSPAPSGSPDAGSPGTEEPPLVATVLLSDGANSTGRLDPIQAAGQAAEAGVPIYTIALGTDEGRVQVQDEFGLPHVLNVPPDRETLAAIAEDTGGRFFEAPTAQDLRAVYDSLGSKVGSRLEQQEVTQWFAAAALMLVLVGGGLASLWFNRFP